MSPSRETPHLPDSSLEAWADGRLESAELEQVEEHLAGCAACRSLAEDLRDFSSLGARDLATGMDESQLDQALGELRGRILIESARTAETEATVLPFVTPPTPGPAPLRAEGFGRRSLFSAWAVAATVVIAVGALGLAVERQLEVSRLGDELKRSGEEKAALQQRLGRPLANLEIVELRPQPDTLRGGADSTAISGGVAFVLRSSLPLPPGPWRALVLAGEEGKLVLEIPGLTSKAGELHFLLPPESIAPGDYRIRLVHEDGSSWPELFPLPLKR